MEIIHAETYNAARRKVRDLKERQGDGATVYRIVRSRYGGFDVIAVDPDVYADMLAAQWVDGLPAGVVLRQKRFMDAAA